MRRDSGTPPSLVWRVALRFALVFAIQVLVLGILLLAVPGLTRSLGELVSDGRRAVVELALSSNGRGLERIVVFAAAELGAEAPLPERTGDEATVRWWLVYGAGATATTLTAATPDWVVGMSGDMVARLEAAESADGRGWAYVAHEGRLYAVGGCRLADVPSSWLLAVEDATSVIQQALSLTASGEYVPFTVASGLAQDVTVPTYSSLLQGVLPVTVEVPDTVGDTPVELQFSVPVTRLAYVFRASALVLAASYILLAGSLLLAFLSTYAQVMQPFNARLRALREYALTGRWDAPREVYREHQLATAAITEAVRAREAAERQAEQRMAELRTVMDSMPALVTVKDVDLRLRLVNEAFRQSVGRGSDDLLGKTDADLFPADLATTYTGHDREVLGLGHPVQYEEEAISPAGKRIYRVVKAPVSESDGKVSGIVSIAIDITEQQDLESRLVEAQKMQVVGRLAGGLSHAFNNLLTTIIGSAELALLGMDGANPSRREVEEIRKAAERGGELSRQLLTLSRQRLAKMTVTDANQLIDSMLPALRETLGDGVVVEAVLGDDAPPVKADPTQLRQMILNLAINGGEAMPDGGPLRIATSRREAPREAVALEPLLGRGPVFCLSVKDSGVGFSGDAREHVFEPFFTTKGASQGRGLGLPVAYSIARQHKGVILYESEEGRGTEFSVYMPGFETEPAVESVPPSRSDEAPRGREVVLLVEDDELVRQLAQRLLVAQGYTVWSADSGERALAVLEEAESDPDLLLTDVIMPGISGVELARVLHKERPRIRILLMSGYAGDADEQTMGGFPMLWKPFTLQSLAQRVRAILDA